MKSKCLNAKPNPSGYAVIWPICHLGFELDLAFELWHPPCHCEDDKVSRSNLTRP